MPPTPILMIGYGNSLRSDDGVGRYLVEIIEQQQLTSVKTISVHQLTPELVVEMANSKAVIFIDATACLSFEITVQMIEPIKKITRLGHTSNPESLLSLCQKLYNKSPASWLITIPTNNFDLGENFSDLTRSAIPPALIILTQLIRILSI